MLFPRPAQSGRSPDENPGKPTTPPALTVLINRGNGSFAPPIEVTLDTRWISYFGVPSDVDHDGREDLVFSSPFDSLVVTLHNATRAARNEDHNFDGVPDECQSRPFRRGDPDESGRTDLNDGAFLLRYLFAGGAEPRCLETCDTDNNGRLELTDALALLNYLFRGGPPPADPGPSSPCGSDADAAGSFGDLGCREYSPCDGK